VLRLMCCGYSRVFLFFMRYVATGVHAPMGRDAVQHKNTLIKAEGLCATGMVLFRLALGCNENRSYPLFNT
jgi:hypothetical protein